MGSLDNRTFKTSKTKRVMVDMSATIIHHGHIRILKAAKELGVVVVALTADDEILKTKGYIPELIYSEREEILLAITVTMNQFGENHLKLQIVILVVHIQK